ncbi:MAG: hypothetical protein WCW27_01605 [Patescibacteria group bacterium]
MKKTTTFYVISCICFGLAVGIKLFVLPLVLLIIVPLLYQQILSLQNITKNIKKLFNGIVYFIVGFIAANSYIIRYGFKNYNDKLEELNIAVISPNFQHAIKPLGIISRIQHWIYNPGKTYYDINTIGMSHEIINIFLFVGFAILLIYLLIRNIKQKNQLFYMGLIIGFSGVSLFIITIIITNRVWMWYLLSAVYVMAIGFGVVTVYLNKNKPGKYFIIIFLLLHWVFILPGTITKYKQYLNSRFDKETISYNNFYINCILKHQKELTTSSVPGSIVKLHRTPVPDALLLTTCWGQTISPVPCLTNVTTHVIQYNTLPENDKNILLNAGFEEIKCSEQWSIYQRVLP